MEGIIVFRVLVVLEGILLLSLDFYHYAKRRMTDGVALLWILCSLSVCVVGLAPLWDRWNRLVGVTGGILMAALCGLWLLAMFWITVLLSQLIQKNHELAMQVSLLNQENEMVLGRLENMCLELAEYRNRKDETDEKDTVCD